MPLDPHTRQKISPLINRIRDHTLRRGEGSFSDLGRLLGCKKADTLVKMTNDELKKALLSFGIVLSSKDMNQILAAFRDEVGYILVNDFFTYLKDTLNPNRIEVVDEAFRVMDANGSGLVDINDLRGRYDAKENPLVKRGERTEDEILEMMLATFDNKHNPDGKVTLEEFRRYYAGVGAGIPEDEYFVFMVRQAWRLDERPPPPPPKKAFVPEAHVIGKSEDPNEAFHKPKRVVGYTGHVPLAHERYGETFHQVEAQTPALKKNATSWQVGSYVDENNAFIRKGNKANAHSFKMA